MQRSKLWQYVVDICDIIAKLAIPLAIVYFAYIQNQASLAHEVETKVRESNIKLLEISWSSLLNEDEARKRLGLKLLETIDKDLSGKVAFALSQDLSQPASIRHEASILTAKASTPYFIGYKIDIYFLEGVLEAEVTASKIMGIIRRYFADTKIVIAPRNREFFNNIVPPRGNEIRFEPGIEDAAARGLMSLLNSAEPTLDMKMKEVYATKTPQTLSILVSAAIEVPKEAVYDTGATAD